MKVWSPRRTRAKGVPGLLVCRREGYVVKTSRRQPQKRKGARSMCKKKDNFKSNRIDYRVGDIANDILGPIGTFKGWMEDTRANAHITRVVLGHPHVKSTGLPEDWRPHIKLQELNHITRKAALEMSIPSCTSFRRKLNTCSTTVLLVHA